MAEATAAVRELEIELMQRCKGILIKILRQK